MEETPLEIWKVIKDFPKYEVSTFGNVRYIEKQRILTGYIKNGYKYVLLQLSNSIQKSMSVHRLVAITFIPNNENKKTVNHKDHNSLNNYVNNLEWFTQKEQNLHRRQPDKKIKELANSRKIWRIDKITNKKLELYSTIRLANKWIFDNKLTTVKDEKRLGTKIIEVAQGNRLTAYGFKWMYEQEENFPDEIWKPITSKIINGTEGYFVSSLGRVKNRKGKITNGHTKNNNYLRITIMGYSYQIHRLVAQTFLHNSDPINKTIVNHKDGNKLNATLSNLEWCTPQENSIHAIESGLVNRKKNIIQYDFKLVKLNEFNSIKEASEKLNINASSIGLCCNGKQHTAGNFIFRFKNDNKISTNDIKLSIKPVVQYDLNMIKLNEFKSQSEASRKLNIPSTYISKCCLGKKSMIGGFIFKFKD